MSRLARLVFACLIISTALLSDIASLADEHPTVREAWQARFAENKSIIYRAVGVQTLADSQESRRSAKKTNLRIQAWMDCERRKFRFDVGEGPTPSRVFMLDDRTFYMCRRNGGAWNVASARSLEPNSEWLQVYPFLIAHGVVPLPPFEAPRIARINGNRNAQARESVRFGEATFRFAGDQAASVTVTHDSDGLVSRYLVTREGRRVLEINNKYKRSDGAVRLDRFEVVVCDPGGAAETQFEGRVDEFVADAPLAPELFARPRSSSEIRKSLGELLEKSAKVEIGMTVGEVASALQSAVGRNLQVRVDREALERAREADAGAMRLEPGEAKLSDVLFHDLRNNFMDFAFDLQGIVIIPRRDAWPRAELVEYSAANHGLSAGELRDLIYRGATLDDWSDVGGPAMMLVDEEQGRVSVFHTQSDHFRFANLLSELADENNQ